MKNFHHHQKEREIEYIIMKSLIKTLKCLEGKIKGTVPCEDCYFILEERIKVS